MQLGQAANAEAAREAARKYRDETGGRGLRRPAGVLGRYLRKAARGDPDPSLTRWSTSNNPRQVHDEEWSRYRRCNNGLGERGMGFRDSSQDGWECSTACRGRRELMQMLLAAQKLDARAMHQFNPLTMVANEV